MGSRETSDATFASAGAGAGAGVVAVMRLVVSALGGIATLAILLVLATHVLGLGYTSHRMYVQQAAPWSPTNATVVTQQVLGIVKAFTQLPASFTKVQFLQTSSLSATMFHDGILLACFCAMHSLFAHRELKQLLREWHRPLYILASCYAMQVVYQRWMVGPELLDATEYLSEQTLFYIRVAALVSSAAIILCDDLLDLLGIRQAMFRLQNRRYYRKAKALQELDVAIRHRPFLSVLALILAYPSITADRACLALTFVVYTALAFNVSEDNVDYVGSRVKSKVNRVAALGRS